MSASRDTGFVRRWLSQVLLFCAALLALSVSAQAATPMPWSVTDLQWQQVRSLRGLYTQPGMSVPALYIFFDPDCPWCAKLWQMQLDGKPFKDVPAVWIPVTYLASDSLGKGAALLRQGNKAALERNFAHYDTAHRSGGIAAVEPSATERQALGHAKAVWLQLGGATPMFVYRTSTGEALVYLGLPKDSAALASIVHTLAPPHLSVYPE
ncbi:MAG: hypothetical protein ABIT70_08425 [Sulfuriferula sp.]